MKHNTTIHIHITDETGELVASFTLPLENSRGELFEWHFAGSTNADGTMKGLHVEASLLKTAWELKD
jgi:hypothetical protein